MSSYIWVKTECSNYYHFIRKVQYLGIVILKIKYKDKTIYLKIKESDLEKLDKYLVSYKFQKERHTGLKNVFEQAKKNWIFISASIVGILLFLVLQNLILEVNIIHENKEIRWLLEDELEGYGIKVLRFKKSYAELDKIRQEILDKYPQALDWMEFDVDGMVVNVRVEERIITDTSKSDKICDLVALKNGVVTKIMVEDGEAAVMINDYVRTGETLITGIIKYNEEEKRYVCAKGEVYATTWYTASVSIPLKATKAEKTGKVKYNIVWDNGGIKKKILRSRFTTYETEYKNIFHIFNFNLYLASEAETQEKEVSYSESDALKLGINKAIDSISKTLKDQDEIVESKILKKSLNDNTLDLEVFVIVNELISTEKEITIDTEAKENKE